MAGNRARWNARRPWLAASCRLCIEMGGSITGEHGVGVEKLEYLPAMFNADEMDCMMRLRAAFDPLCIANPGKKFPRAGAPALQQRGLHPLEQDRRDLTRVMLMAEPLTPTTADELAEAVRAHAARAGHWRAHQAAPLASPGGRHFALHARPARHRGIRAGGVHLHRAGRHHRCARSAKPWRRRGNTLPFDPMWLEAGATLGGTVCAGVSGPGRFRFGGVRDFILGIRFVDGLGRLLRMGGKVVKNCAGFDLPKFFVGSLGRYGALAEITFKVFPTPASRLTLKLPTTGAEAAARVLTDAANSRWECEALDLLPDGATVCLRLAGPAPALEAVSREVLARWPGQVLSAAEADAVWSELRELRWTHPGGALVKVAIDPSAVPALAAAAGSLDGTRVHFSAGGNVAFVSLPSTGAAHGVAGTVARAGSSRLLLSAATPRCGAERARLPPSPAPSSRRSTRNNRFPSTED